jgi:lipid-binding SYLF domain-containing protein
MMNQAGSSALTDRKATIGADVSIAAGPVGRNAGVDTDAQMNASILSYVRAPGVFAGTDLKGFVISEDDEVNQALYGRRVSNKDILTGRVPSPEGALNFERALKNNIR